MGTEAMWISKLSTHPDPEIDALQHDRTSTEHRPILLQSCSSHCISTTQLYKLPGLPTDDSEFRYTARRHRAHHHQLLPKKSQLAYVRCNQCATPTCIWRTTANQQRHFTESTLPNVSASFIASSKVKIAKKRREADFLSRSLVVANLIRFH